jgi:hypothetical protein
MSKYFVEEGCTGDGEWFVFDNDACYCVAGPYGEEEAAVELLRLKQQEHDDGDC